MPKQPPPSASRQLPAVVLYGYRRRVSECARCERVRPLWFRGLCCSCAVIAQRNGTIAEFGYVKADRIAAYARLRGGGATIGGAAERLGVCKATAERYERELREAGQAPWREWRRVA